MTLKSNIYFNPSFKFCVWLGGTIQLMVKRTRPFVRCVRQGRPTHRTNRVRCLVEIWGAKNPGSTNKYTKFGQLIIEKIIQIIATRCHILG